MTSSNGKPAAQTSRVSTQQPSNAPTSVTTLPRLQVIATCHGIGIIDAQTGQPDTTKIDRHMVNKMATISERKQRELVLLLFFMEEEIVRWRLLGREEEEIRERLQDRTLEGEVREELEQFLAMVRDRKVVLPSFRDESGRMKDGGDDGALPSYAEAGGR